VLDPDDPLDGIDALVGGLAPRAAVTVPWMLPAVPSAAGGEVVRAETTAVAAGQSLGEDLRDQQRVRTIGVVVGDGPDAVLRDGLTAAGLTVVSEQARPGSDCQRELRSLRVRAPSALAIAGGPDLVRLCVDAAMRSGWRPHGGVLVPPSLAYDDFDPAWSGVSVRTALGLPGPMGTDPGATRFRASTGFTSYRAMVTFAATELAIAVARSAGSVTATDVSHGHWYSDLFRFDGATNRGIGIARASALGWTR
jgi:hypothetical protein